MEGEDRRERRREERERENMSGHLTETYGHAVCHCISRRRNDPRDACRGRIEDFTWSADQK